MSELMKDMFHYDSLHEIAVAIQAVYHPFPVDEFLSSVLDESWNSLELKARGRKITMNLGKYLPENYEEALSILEQGVVGFPVALFFPDFIEAYGQDENNLDLSIRALKRNTENWSSELAVRPFIVKYEERMLEEMYAWSKDKNEHIRRLASEGCRPQLPWGQVLVKYKKDPTPILPILEQLKADSSPYVRKSVANNLNDISKTHPDLVIKIAKDWYGKEAGTDWIVKHGCRTLLKKGNRDVLAIFGYDDSSSIEVKDFRLKADIIELEDNLTFSFTISSSKSTKVRLEYGIDYVKFNGKRNRKIFQISESLLKEDKEKQYTKTHSFKDLSIRKHYPGIHSITLIVNGVEQDKLDFELKKK